MNFNGQKLLIATKHSKEQVMAPFLERALLVSCFTEPDYDTDVLGTFSGEIERTLDPIQTLRKKAMDAAQRYRCNLVVANEGSFGPHPLIPFSHADEEWVIFMDLEDGLELIAREISTATNFCGKEIYSEKELIDFAARAGFPGHGLILKSAECNWETLYKGISDKKELIAHFRSINSKYGKAYIETDMRACYNPSRMLVIEKATQNLIEKIKSLCPSCQWPGFEVSEARKGLPCQLCGWPTSGIKSHLYACRKCGFSVKKSFPFGKYSEDPQYCFVCNP